MVEQMVLNQGEWRGEDNILREFQHGEQVRAADDKIQVHDNGHL